MSLDLGRLENSQGLLEFGEFATVALRKASLPPCPSRSGECSCPQDGCRRTVKWSKLPRRADMEEGLADLERLSGCVSANVAAGQLDGFKAVALDRKIIEAGRILKAAFGMLASSAGQPLGEACANKEEHTPGCRCKRLRRFERMAAEEV